MKLKENLVTNYYKSNKNNIIYLDNALLLTMRPRWKKDPNNRPAKELPTA